MLHVRFFYQPILWFFIGLLLWVIPASAKKKSPTVWVHIQVTQTSDYCGGAAPSEEMLSRLKTPTPLKQKTIYIRAGSPTSAEIKTIQVAKSDSNGMIHVALKGGRVYHLVEEWKAKPFVEPKNTEYIQWDMTCLRKAYTTPDLIIDLRKSRIPVKRSVNYHKPCFFHPYCGNYSGPLPP